MRLGLQLPFSVRAPPSPHPPATQYIHFEGSKVYKHVRTLVLSLEGVGGLVVGDYGQALIANAAAPPYCYALVKSSGSEGTPAMCLCPPAVLPTLPIAAAQKHERESGNAEACSCCRTGFYNHPFVA